MQKPLSYRHRVITDDDIVIIRKLIADHPGASRKALSRQLCVAWNGSVAISRRATIVPWFHCTFN
jgi:hypothetical protein